MVAEVGFIKKGGDWLAWGIGEGTPSRGEGAGGGAGGGKGV